MLKKWIQFIILFFIVIMISCKTYQPIGQFQERTIPSLDYSDLALWAAHPSKDDPSDRCPDEVKVPSTTDRVDVFFIHPTTYTGSKGQDQWNASIVDIKLNKKTDEGSILFQASAFNQAGRVYAPRYRQAHLHCYFSSDKKSALKAFELAYGDVRNAFEHYLKYENKGKPFIIASHSQGTNHAERLIKELIDGQPIQAQLVAAYLIGMPIHQDEFVHVKPCENGDQTSCFVSWRTMRYGAELNMGTGDILVTNPLSWSVDQIMVPKQSNPGTLLRKFGKLYDGLVDAQANEKVLWAHKPKFFGSIFLTTDNYHVADINFYYISIRENAVNRVERYFESR